MFMNDATKLCSKFNSLGSPCLHCGSKSKASWQHPSKCTVLWQLCVLHLCNLRYGFGNVRMFPPSAPGRRTDHNKGGGWAGTSGGQVAADREWKGTVTPASTLHSFVKKRSSEQTGTGAGSEGARSPSHAAGDLRSGTSPRHVMGDLRATRSTEFSSIAVQSRASVERQSTKGCRESAPSMRLYHMPHGAPLKILEDLKRPLLNQGWLTEAGWQYQTWCPSMGALMVNKDKAPVPPQQVIQELKEIIPLLSTPYMIHRFHANRAIKESSDRVSAFQLEVSGRTEGSHKVWRALETLSNCSVLQIIGIQLRRDTLRHSPAAELVQKLISNS